MDVLIHFELQRSANGINRTETRLNILPSHQPREDYLSNYLFTRIHSHQIALKQNPYLEEKPKESVQH